MYKCLPADQNFPSCATLVAPPELRLGSTRSFSLRSRGLIVGGSFGEILKGTEKKKKRDWSRSSRKSRILSVLSRTNGVAFPLESKEKKF